MNIKLSIKNRFTGSLIFEYEKQDNTMKETIKEAINSGADLSRADLYGANLSGVDLSGTNLYGTNLSGANLSRANLSGADLSGVDLSGADLYGANLSFADLSGTNLSGANLSRADLSGANLSRADLSGTNLYGANLYGANLSFADLYGANLSTIKHDFWDVLLHSIPEIEFLKQNIIEGKIDGSTYEGECSCLSGTLVRGAKEHNGPQEKSVINSIMSARNSHRPIEGLFMSIKKGDTPETNQISKIVLEWLEEFESYLINAAIPV